jgi:K+-transporting ATPase ATPase A chain
LFSWLNPFWAIVVPIAVSIPLGWTMFRALDRPDEKCGKGADAVALLLLRAVGRSRPEAMGWKR